jgi:hypothetical protein
MKVKITTDHLYLLTTFLSFLNMWIVNINDQSRFQLSFQQFTKKQIVNKKKGACSRTKGTTTTNRAIGYKLYHTGLTSHDNIHIN